MVQRREACALAIAPSAPLRSNSSVKQQQSSGRARTQRRPSTDDHPEHAPALRCPIARPRRARVTSRSLELPVGVEFREAPFVKSNVAPPWLWAAGGVCHRLATVPQGTSGATLPLAPSVGSVLLAPVQVVARLQLPGPFDAFIFCLVSVRALDSKPKMTYCHTEP